MPTSGKAVTTRIRLDVSEKANMFIDEFRETGLDSQVDLSDHSSRESDNAADTLRPDLIIGIKSVMKAEKCEGTFFKRIYRDDKGYCK